MSSKLLHNNDIPPLENGIKVGENHSYAALVSGFSGGFLFI